MNIIVFDGVCNFCNRVVQIIIRHDPSAQIHFTAQQTEAGEKLLHQYSIKESISSVVFITKGAVYYQSDAVIEIAKLLTGWPSVFKYTIIVPRFFRNYIYQLIAANRYRLFGKQDQCMVPKEEDKKRFI
ncbi:MAG: thiol-disulfide oxidoreductase DCC family protein [Chitinophagaceae bacterium]|jgi:predicted DCC family thiol-disulfide oxidoreductase YuxK|nr:DCC1-like thiol-disulfide oxidoreductase family protein [Sediminibacterium sp.]